MRISKRIVEKFTIVTAWLKAKSKGPGRGLCIASPRIAIIPMLAALLYCPVSTSQAHATTLFPGGDCTLITQANGIRLDFCKNLTTQTVDDIHVTFTHPNLPAVLVDYGQSLGCTVLGVGNCFGPAVAPNANWNGSNGGAGPVSNILLWDDKDLDGVNFNFDSVKATGYWTKGGKPVAVPEPALWTTMILALFGLGGALRGRRNRRCEAVATA